MEEEQEDIIEESEDSTPVYEDDRTYLREIGYISERYVE